MIKIYRKISDVERKVAEISSKKALHTTEIMGVDEVFVSVIVDDVIDVQEGDYIYHKGIIYTLNRDAEYTIASDVKYSYDLTFEHPFYVFLNKLYCNKITGYTSFTLTGKLRDFVELLIWCINITPGNPDGVDTGWTLGECPDTDYKNIAFTDIKCKNVLDVLFDEFGFEYYFNNKQVNFVERVEHLTDFVFEQGRGKGLYELRRQNIDKEDTITRLIVRGGNKNVPIDYADEEGYLKLPENYIENFTEHAKVVEKKVKFKEEFPHFLGTVENVSGTNNKEIICQTIDFDLDAIAVGDNRRINFLSNDLTGCSFEFLWDNVSKKITLIEQEDDTALEDNSGNKENIPNALKKAKVGDTFNFTGVLMPSVYVTDSLNRLRTKGYQKLSFFSKKRVKFSLEIDYRYMRGKPELVCGDLVVIYIPKKSFSQIIRITRIERNIDSGKLYATVSNYLEEDWKKYVESKVNDTKNEILAQQVNLKNTLTSIFKDGFVSDAELKTIEAMLRNLQVEHGRMNAQYLATRGNIRLTNKTEITLAWNNYQMTFDNIISSITDAVSDGVIVNDEVADVETKLSAYSTQLNNLTTAIQNANDIITTNTANTAIDNIAIGTRNLALKSGVSRTSNGYRAQYYYLSEPLKIGVDYTVQIWGAKPPDGYWRPHTNTFGADDFATPVYDDTYYQITFKPREEATMLQIYRTPDSGSYGTIDKVQIVEGNKALADWSPAPEDSFNDAINNIAVGGRNIVRDSAYLQMYPNNVGSGASVLMTDETEKYYRATPSSDKRVSLYGAIAFLEDGKPYVSSIYVRQNSGEPMEVHSYRMTSNVIDSVATIQSGVWTRIHSAVSIGEGNNSYYIVEVNTGALGALLDYKKVSTVEGNKALADWTAAPEDIIAYIDAVGVDISDLSIYINGAFKDGIVSESEAVAIQKYLNTIDESMSRVTASYNSVYNNTLLDGTNEKSQLLAKYTLLLAARSSLVIAISNVIEDNLATAEEIVAVNNAFTTFNSRMSDFQIAFEAANLVISKKTVDDAINNIEVGGENYCMNSNLKNYSSIGMFYKNNYSLLLNVPTYFDVLIGSTNTTPSGNYLENGATYTITVKQLTRISGTGSSVQFVLHDYTGVNTTFVFTTLLMGTNRTATFTVPSTGNYSLLMYCGGYNASNGEILAKGLAVINNANLVGWDAALNSPIKADDWHTYNGGVEAAAQGYHAHIDDWTFDFPVAAFIDRNSICGYPHRWMALARIFTVGSYEHRGLVANQEYTISLDVYSDTVGAALDIGLYYKITGNPDYNFYNNCIIPTPPTTAEEVGKWVRKSVKMRLHEDFDSTSSATIYIYGQNNPTECTQYATKIMIAKGNVAGDYTKSNYEIDSELTELYQSVDALTLAQAQQTAAINLARAITDKFGTTIDGGLVSAVVMLLRALDSQTETAGISGIQKDSVGNYLPAVWSGGTYAEAIAGIAKNIERHDGTGHKAGGNLRWDKDGNVYFTGTINATAGVFSGKVDIGDGKILLNEDGSGWLANKKFIWDEDGNSTYSGAVKSEYQNTEYNNASINNIPQMINLDKSFYHIISVLSGVAPILVLPNDLKYTGIDAVVVGKIIFGTTLLRQSNNNSFDNINTTSIQIQSGHIYRFLSIPIADSCRWILISTTTY